MLALSTQVDGTVSLRTNVHMLLVTREGFGRHPYCTGEAAGPGDSQKRPCWLALDVPHSADQDGTKGVP